MAAFEIDDDKTRIDRDIVWSFLSTEAYWGRWRTRTHVERQIDLAWRVVGAYFTDTGAMVGYARAFSDGVGSAYLGDVFVVPQARGLGIGKALVRAMVEEGPGADFRWMLHTADADDLYRQFGFTEPTDTFLERPDRRARA